MEIIKSKEYIKNQYNGSSNLQTRIYFHSKYSTNRQTFNDWLFNNYVFHKGCKVLELGSGGGGMWLDKLCSFPNDIDITLSDFSDGMVKELKEKFDYPYVNIKKIDIQDIPFGDNSFDIVIANFMLYHVPDIEKAISEVARVLKKYGIFYSATNSSEDMRSFFESTLKEFDAIIEMPKPLSFLLDNGREYLDKHFNLTTINTYKNDADVTDVNDLLDYLYSGSLAKNIDKYTREDLYNFYESKKDNNGIIHINKQAGTFIAKK